MRLSYKDTHSWAWSGRCCAGYLHPNILKVVLKKPYMKKPPTSTPGGAASSRIGSVQWAGGLQSVSAKIGTRRQNQDKLVTGAGCTLQLAPWAWTHVGATRSRPVGG